MPTNRLRCAPLLTAALLALLAAPLAAAPDTPPKPEPAPKGPRVVVEIQGLHYVVGKPVFVRITARNDGEAPAPTPLGDPIAAGLVLKDAAGKVYKPAGAGAPIPEQRPGVLGARSYFGQVIDVAALFPVLAQKGKYTLTYAQGALSSDPVTVNMLQPYNASSIHTATIKTRLGDLKLEFFPKEAPITVKNFIELSRLGFYDGLSFHYIRPGEMIAGGDPNGDGSGGSGFFIPPEFSDRKHLAGTLGMVRIPDPEASASSQFYICLAPQPERDGHFTVFAQVVEGMDVLKKISEVPTTGRKDRPYFKPLQPVLIDSITITEKAAKASS
jgi:peptidyl-prolyl cis-trans isomerase B (cyclophilin B)